MTDDFLPLDLLIVNGVEIPGNKIQAQSIYHEIDEGKVTVTFCNVRTVETVYKHMERGEKAEPPSDELPVRTEFPPCRKCGGPVEGHSEWNAQNGWAHDECPVKPIDMEDVLRAFERGGIRFTDEHGEYQEVRLEMWHPHGFSSEERIGITLENLTRILRAKEILP